MEIKTMTREELDEAIAELHEPKPTSLPCDASEEYRDLSGAFYWVVESRPWRWGPAYKPTKSIAAAKALTDELVAEGWSATIYIGTQRTRVLHGRVGFISADVIASTEELARAMAYYEARTGVRVVINDE